LLAYQLQHLIQRSGYYKAQIKQFSITIFPERKRRSDEISPQKERIIPDHDGGQGYQARTKVRGIE
jgi:hypothetical protein